MGVTPDTILLCSCEDSQRPDAEAIARAFPETRIVTARHACGEDIGRFRDTARAGTAVVACTAMADIFRAIAAEDGLGAELLFGDIREAAGWSTDGHRAGPKMAGLLAMATETAPPPPAVTLTSEGRALIVGRDGDAVEAARRLQDRLDVTLVLPRTDDVPPSRRDRFALAAGHVRRVTGHLGAFRVAIEGYAPAAPSSRDRVLTGAAAQTIDLSFDVIVDLSGGTGFVPAPDLRPGYVKADPGSPTAVADAVLTASDLTGTFDKPQFVAYRESICAHSRSRKTGCRRCLDVCPTGAITPAGDHVSIDPAICAGCGSCASVCPTGAASYALPPADGLMRRLRALMGGWQAAGGGREAVVLFHDDDHGADLLEALARFGDGLPAHVLPVAVNEVTQVGPEQIAALFAYGASGVRFLTRARPRHDTAALSSTIGLMRPVLSELGYGEDPVGLIETDDPDGLGVALRALEPGIATDRPARFLADGPKRAVFDLALSQLHAAAPRPVDTVPLPDGAPFGRVLVDTDGCTLCLACTSACPTAALGDNPDRPMLTFEESLCVQCGLCASTCPEQVITLEPRLRFDRGTGQRTVIKEEEPFACVSCGKAFGTRSSIERVIGKLAAGHWMFTDGGLRLDLLRMCDTCRVGAVTRSAVDPYAGPDRPKPKTSEDYRRERVPVPEDGDG